jgi:hypothetical protein
MMLHPTTDEVRKSMFETLCHTTVAVIVVVGATVLAVEGNIDSAAWAGACGTAIAASGAVTVVRRSDVDRPREPEERPVVVLDRRNDNTSEGGAGA